MVYSHNPTIPPIGKPKPALLAYSRRFLVGDCLCRFRIIGPAQPDSPKATTKAMIETMIASKAQPAENHAARADDLAVAMPSR